jgi:hypothetical protein
MESSQWYFDPTFDGSGRITSVELDSSVISSDSDATFYAVCVEA